MIWGLIAVGMAAIGCFVFDHPGFGVVVLVAGSAMVALG